MTSIVLLAVLVLVIAPALAYAWNRFIADQRQAGIAARHNMAERQIHSATQEALRQMRRVADEHKRTDWPS